MQNGSRWFAYTKWNVQLCNPACLKKVLIQKDQHSSSQINANNFWCLSLMDKSHMHSFNNEYAKQLSLRVKDIFFQAFSFPCLFFLPYA